VALGNTPECLRDDEVAMGLGGSDLNLLVALRTLLEEVNVTRAGDRLGMTQPAMSGVLARLRRQYKDELLVRVGREYELTPLARALIPQVQQAMPLIEDALMFGRDFDAASSDRCFTIALSDYAITVVNQALRARISETAPGVRLNLQPIPMDMHTQLRGLLEVDFLIAPLGFAFHGDSMPLLRDRFVCVVDPANPRLRHGGLTIADLAALPHARAMFGRAHLTPVDRQLSEMNIDTRSGVRATGWLPLPFLVAGTDMVAVVPERLARRIAAMAGVIVVDLPVGEVTLVESLWWHPSRAGDPALRWLRSVIQDVASQLNPASVVLTV
jgi:DNA-binding transcriptional LysR family regulator